MTAHAALILDAARYLRLVGWVVLVTPRGGIPGAPGCPDIIAFKAGRTVFLEGKCGRDRLQYDQIKFQGDIEAQGFEFYEVRNLDSVMEVAR